MTCKVEEYFEGFWISTDNEKNQIIGNTIRWKNGTPSETFTVHKDDPYKITLVQSVGTAIGTLNEDVNNDIKIEIGISIY